MAGPGSEAAALVVSVALLGVALPLFEAAQFVAGVASGHFDPEVTTGVLLEDVFGFHGVAGCERPFRARVGWLRCSHIVR